MVAVFHLQIRKRKELEWMSVHQPGLPCLLSALGSEGHRVHPEETGPSGWQHPVCPRKEPYPPMVVRFTSPAWPWIPMVATGSSELQM